MQVARVIGDVVATGKDGALKGITLQLLQTLDAGRQPVGRTLEAADTSGAGRGEIVIFVRGRETEFPFYPVEPPVDGGSIGIVDPGPAGDREARA